MCGSLNQASRCERAGERTGIEVNNDGAIPRFATSRVKVEHVAVGDDATLARAWQTDHEYRHLWLHNLSTRDGVMQYAVCKLPQMEPVKQRIAKALAETKSEARKARTPRDAQGVGTPCRQWRCQGKQQQGLHCRRWLQLGESPSHFWVFKSLRA